MRPALDTYEKIDLYLEGKLSGSALLEFEAQLQVDKNLQSTLASVKLTNELVINHELLALKARMQKDMKDIPFASTQATKNLKKWGVVSFLSISIIALVWWFGNKTPEATTPTQMAANKTIAAIRPTKTQAVNLVAPTQETVERLHPEITSVQAPTLVQAEQLIVNTSTSHEPISLNLKTAQAPVPNSSNTSAANPCAGVVLQSQVKVSQTCQDNANGEINFEQLKNGKAPYQYSINNGNTFTQNAHFTHLQAGEYKLSIKDDHGCETGIPSILITTKDCHQELTNFAFNPQYHETFQVPVKEGQAGTIQVYTRTGTLVFTATFMDTYSWDGTQTNGSSAIPSLYKYLIELTDGSIKKGTVTIYE